jgi:hypothetical protein
VDRETGAARVIVRNEGSRRLVLNRLLVPRQNPELVTRKQIRVTFLRDTRPHDGAGAERAASPAKAAAEKAASPVKAAPETAAAENAAAEKAASPAKAVATADDPSEADTTEADADDASDPCTMTCILRFPREDEAGVFLRALKKHRASTSPSKRPPPPAGESGLD